MSLFSGLNSKKGFTLLELLIVIVVIGVLAIIIIPNLVSGPTRARDSQRKADMQTVKNALETYYNDNNSYPVSLQILTQGAAPYIKTLPTDPKTKTIYSYTTAGNPPSSYILKVTLENPNDKDIKSGTKNTYELNSTN
ncbi:MAG: prepilin-type N-terminal cleavage/methylation domain-containing protein [Candidatus Saccharibacteria bacterium]